MDEGEEDYKSMVQQIKKNIYALMIISFILLETDSVIIQAPLVVVVVTRVLTPPLHFSCFQNNHKYVKVTLMAFTNTRKCHRDVIKSESGDEPHDSERKGSWSPKQLIHGPSTWETLIHTGNKAKTRLLAYKILKNILKIIKKNYGAFTTCFFALCNSWT